MKLSFEQTGGTYVMQGDYFLPNLTLPTEEEGITETLKSADAMAWVQRMNNIRKRATEIINCEFVFVLNT